MRALILILTALTLGGCTASLSPVSPGVLASPPAALTAPCAAPEPVAGALVARDVLRLWALDRGALVACGERVEALGAWVVERDGKLATRR
jgi:hypothetical protein